MKNWPRSPVSYSCCHVSLTKPRASSYMFSFRVVSMILGPLNVIKSAFHNSNILINLVINCP